MFDRLSHRRISWLPAALLLAAVLLSCNLLTPKAPPTATPARPTAAPTQAPTQPQASVETQPPLPTVTSEPVTPNEPTPAPQEPPVITPTYFPLGEHLTPAGPWLLIAASTGLWATNADGSGMTRLTQEPIRAPQSLDRAISPDGKSVAFITSDADTLHNLTLHLLTLPDGTDKIITKLTNKNTEPAPDAVMLDDKIEATRAITDVDSLDWSPDGQTLAFIGVQDGPSADLYTYSLATGKITRVSDGPSQAFGPHWSPDGKYIVHFGTSSFGTGAGFGMTGGWAASPDGSTMLTLFSGGNAREFRGWISNDEFLMDTWTAACGPEGLVIYNLKEQRPYTLVKGCFSGAAATNITGLMVVVGGSGAELQGIYTFGPNNVDRKELSRENANSVDFKKDAADFLVGGDHGYTVVSNEGTIVARSPQINCEYGLTTAGYGLLYAWACDGGQDTGVWVNGPGVPDRQVFNQPALRPTWNNHNDLLVFSGKTLYYGQFMQGWVMRPMSQIDGDVHVVAWVGK